MNIGKSEFYFGSDFQDTRREMLTEFGAMWIVAERWMLYMSCASTVATVTLSHLLSYCHHRVHCVLKCLELEKAFHCRFYCYKEIVKTLSCESGVLT